MRLVCISDTHNSHRGIQLPPGDVLIYAGDATSQGLKAEVERFLDWFASQPHPYKILIAGNHDWLFQRHPDLAQQLLASRPTITYLEDSGIEIEGIRFWGSPWQPWFRDWAFNLPRKGKALRETWNRIPVGTDVLITHGPPHGVRDQVHGGEHLGCEELKIRLGVIRPRVHVFGHIHDGFGVTQSKQTVFVNGCTCDEDYRPTHRPIVLDLNPHSVQVLGTESNQRLIRLEQIEASLAAPIQPSKGSRVFVLPITLDDGIREMANIRGISAEELLQDYVRRGLQSDLSRQLRAESRPSRRPTTFTRLEDAYGHE